MWESVLQAFKAVEPVTTALSVLAAIFAAWSAWLSYRLTQSLRNELKSDEILVAGILHHPDLVNLEQSLSVVQTTILNKSKRKAFINKVEMFDRKGESIDVAWASQINAYGGTLGGSQLIAVVDSAELCIRRADGETIREVTVKVHHSHPGSPLVLQYQLGPGWLSFLTS